MKIGSLIIVFLIASGWITSDKKLIGVYKNHFGEKIELKIDSTFKYNWRYGFSSHWSTGIWKTNNDTIYFQVIPIFDTLIIVDKTKEIRYDSLVYSNDEISEKINSDDYLASLLTSGNQNVTFTQKKLFHKKNRLIKISKDDQLERKRVVARTNLKKYPTWYIKQ